jgi:hypothetical protein
MPWAVMGPLERAPFVREAWICFRDHLGVTSRTLYVGEAWADPGAAVVSTWLDLDQRGE